MKNIVLIAIITASLRFTRSELVITKSVLEPVLIFATPVTDPVLGVVTKLSENVEPGPVQVINIVETPISEPIAFTPFVHRTTPRLPGTPV